MLIKFARSQLILNSLRSAFLPKRITAILPLPLIFCFSHSLDDNYSSGDLTSNPPENDQSSQSNPSSKPDFSSEHSQPAAERVKRPHSDKVFHKKSAKVRQQQLSSIIRQYREQSQRSGMNLAKFSVCCKSISKLYRTERHHQFVGQREQLDRMLQVMAKLDFRSTGMADLLNMLDFLRTVGRLEGTNKRTFERARGVVLQTVSKYLSVLQKVPTNELIIVFCKVCSMPYSELSGLTIHLHDRLVDLANQPSGMPLTIYQLYVLMKSLSKKRFLSFPDKRILQMVLVSLSNRMDEIDSMMRTTITKALVDLNLYATTPDRRVLDIGERLMVAGYEAIMKGGSAVQEEYLLQCMWNENKIYGQIVEVIYRKVLEKMQAGKARCYAIKTLVQCVRHFKGASSDDRAVLVTWAEGVCTEGTSNERKTVQLGIIDLLRGRFFGGEVERLSGFVTKPYFQLYWTIPCEYSIQGLVFPVQALVAKMHSGTYSFQQQVSFVRLAVAVAGQLRMHPEHQKLSQLHVAMAENVKNADWQSIGVQWVLRIGLQNPELVRCFVREYGSLFSHRVAPGQEQLKKDFAAGRGERLTHYTFWQYLFFVGEFDDNMPHQLLARMPGPACSLFALRQKNKINCPLDPKPLLLAGFIAKYQTRKMKLSDGESNLILQLLQNYREGLLVGHDSFQQLYMSLCRILVQDYRQLRRQHIPQANFMLMGLLTMRDLRLRNSILYKNILVKLLDNPIVISIDNNNSHFKGAIFRAALENNLLSEQHLPNLEFGFFNEDEQALIKAVAGEYRCEKIDGKTIVPFLRMQSPSAQRLNEFLTEIFRYAQSADVRELQKCLLYFSLEQEEVGNKILLKLVQEFKNKLVVKGIDILGVIANVRGYLGLLERGILVGLLQEICTTLLKSMHDFSLSDHLQLLKYLNMYGVEHQIYLSQLVAYAYAYKYRGSAVVEIMWELCKNKKMLKADDFGLLKNYSTFSPDSFIKLVVLHEQSLPSVDNMLELIGNYQIKAVTDSLVAKYVQSKYGLSLKKVRVGSGLLFPANQASGVLLDLLQQNGVEVKRQQLGIDRVFLLGEQVLLVFTDLQRNNQGKLVEKILGHFYPKRELIMGLSFPTGHDLERLLVDIAPNLQISSAAVAQITQKLSLL